MCPHYPVLVGRLCVVGANRVVAIVSRALLRFTVQRLLIWMSGPCALSGIEFQPVEGVLDHATVASPWSSVDGHRSGQACCETALPERVGAHGRRRCCHLARGAGCRLSIAVVRPMAAARNIRASLTRWISTSQVLMISFPLCRKKGGVDDPVSPLGVPGVDPLSRSPLSGQFDYLVDSGLNRDDGGPG